MSQLLQEQSLPGDPPWACCGIRVLVFGDVFCGTLGYTILSRSTLLPFRVMNAMLKVSNYPKWLCAEDTNKGTRTEEQELTNYWAYVDTKKKLERHCSWMMWGPSIMQVEACNSKIWVFMIYKVHAMQNTLQPRFPTNYDFFFWIRKVVISSTGNEYLVFWGVFYS